MGLLVFPGMVGLQPGVVVVVWFFEIVSTELNLEINTDPWGLLLTIVVLFEASDVCTVVKVGSVVHLPLDELQVGLVVEGFKVVVFLALLVATITEL